MRPTQKHNPAHVIQIKSCAPLFPLGQLLASPEALKAIEGADQSPIYFIARHVTGDWIESGKDNEALNKTALREGGEIFSVFETKLTEDIYLITAGDRLSTKIVLASEY